MSASISILSLHGDGIDVSRTTSSHQLAYTFHVSPIAATLSMTRLQDPYRLFGLTILRLLRLSREPTLCSAMRLCDRLHCHRGYGSYTTRRLPVTKTKADCLRSWQKEWQSVLQHLSIHGQFSKDLSSTSPRENPRIWRSCTISPSVHAFRTPAYISLLRQATLTAVSSARNPAMY